MPIINQSADNTSASASSGQSSLADKIKNINENTIPVFNKLPILTLMDIKAGIESRTGQTVENFYLLGCVNNIILEKEKEEEVKKQAKLQGFDEASSYAHTPSTSAAAAAFSSSSELPNQSYTAPNGLSVAPFSSPSSSSAGAIASCVSGDGNNVSNSVVTSSGGASSSAGVLSSAGAIMSFVSGNGNSVSNKAESRAG